MTETSVTAGALGQVVRLRKPGLAPSRSTSTGCGLPATVSMNEEHPGVYHLHRAHRAPVGEHRDLHLRTWRQVHGTSMNLIVNCVRSVVERSTYPNYEIVVVADVDTPVDSLEELREHAGDRLRIVP